MVITSTLLITSSVYMDGMAVKSVETVGTEDFEAPEGVMAFPKCGWLFARTL